jgi:hypothetical protein
VIVLAVELDVGEPVKPVQLCSVLAEERRKGDSNEALFAAVAVDADE